MMKERHPNIALHSCQLLYLLFSPLNPPSNSPLKSPVRHLQKKKTKQNKKRLDLNDGIPSMCMHIVSEVSNAHVHAI